MLVAKNTVSVFLLPPQTQKKKLYIPCKHSIKLKIISVHFIMTVVLMKLATVENQKRHGDIGKEPKRGK